MVEFNYKELGLRVGLEIHQQLDTKHKLFCDCPTRLASSSTPTIEVIRYLRATKSEIGEIDPAALYEMQRGRKIIYQVPQGHACLVELDEEPPHELNKEALAIAVAIAKALHSTILDEIHVMRKIVIDGSNPTGFQRTAIVAIGGYVDDEEGKVGIQTICVEEDAARKVDEGPDYVKYNLDRLGIPLIEIATTPDIKSPEQALRVAFKIGLIMRLTGKVKRGIGTIRQDLNVSIKNGVKTEIKGVSKLELIPKVIKYEVMRQLKLLEIRDELRRRGLREDELSYEIYDITEIVRKSRSKLIRKLIEKGNRVYAVKLPKLSGILKIEVQPNRRLGTELSDYAKAWGGVGGLIHSDELPGYGIDEEITYEIYEYLGLEKGRDAFALVISDKDRAQRALQAVIDRVKYALKGIPRETRGANPDGTTRYLRPQPGAARMYPETDVPPIKVDESILREASKYVPKTPDELLKELVEVHKLSKDLAFNLIKDPMLHLYLDLISELGNNVPPRIIASTLMIHMKSLKSEGVNVDVIDVDTLKKVLLAVGKGEVAKEAIPEILAEYARRYPKAVIDEIISKFKGLSRDKVVKIVRKIIEDNKDEIIKRGVKAFNFVMGKVMSIVRGKVDGKLVAEIVKNELNRLMS
ncbi:MAG: Glu-tRNA(Gln) amidotransferase GatDE subunit E [Desulfurococcales archaeon ex4484_42]|nr:MAG: Glu-tRNA(Gln) amidotransferase GatDE subunit E [Desulfurococcales archaeon ex4484_42]